MKYDIGTIIVLTGGSKRTIAKVYNDHYVFTNSALSWVDTEIDHKATENLQLENTKLEIGYIAIKCSIIGLKTIHEKHSNFDIKIITNEKDSYLLHITEKYKKLT